MGRSGGWPLSEGLIAELRSERAGRFPERTVYEITSRGREALGAVHGEALRRVVVRPDPFDRLWSTPVGWTSRNSGTS
jgi:DNA-binding PadR family transcriptional regulator